MAGTPDARNALADLLDLLPIQESKLISPADVRAIVKSFPIVFAAADPTATDDASAGYEPGVLWWNYTDNKLSQCEDATTGAPVWGARWPLSASDVGAATSAQGAEADSAVQPGDDANTLGSTAEAAGTRLEADGGGGISWVGAEVVSVTAARDLVQGDNGRRLECDGTFTVTLPAGLAVGFECVIINKGSGIITISAGTGATLSSVGSTLESTDASCYLFLEAGDAWRAIGSLGTPSGTGDMLKADYDTNADDVVNRSDVADGLGETGGPTDLAMGAVADGQRLARSGTDVIGVPEDYDLLLGFVGSPTASQLDWLLAGRAVTIDHTSPGAAYARTNPADGDWVFAVQKNGASAGTVTISTAGAVTWSISADIVLAAGDRLEVVAPSTADSTGADVQFLLRGSV